MPTANRGRRLRRLSPVTWYAALSELPRGALKIITKDAPEEAPARFRAAQSLQLPSGSSREPGPPSPCMPRNGPIQMRCYECTF
jgi:hypothetical protein